MDEVSRLLKQNPALLRARNESGWTALELATFNNEIEIVRHLLAQFANIDDKDDRGWTPLHEAAYNSTVEIRKKDEGQACNLQFGPLLRR